MLLALSETVTMLEPIVAVVVAVVGFGTTFAGLVKLWTKQEMTTKRLGEVLDQQKSDCATWRSSCLVHRKDDHEHFRTDIREMRSEFRELRDCVSAQTTALGVTNQKLQDLIDAMRVTQ